jgi:hypothetical protein
MFPEDVEKDSIMREKYTLADKGRLRGMERKCWVVRGSYSNNLIKLFGRRHGPCTISM